MIRCSKIAFLEEYHGIVAVPFYQHLIYLYSNNDSLVLLPCPVPSIDSGPLSFFAFRKDGGSLTAGRIAIQSLCAPQCGYFEKARI